MSTVKETNIPFWLSGPPGSRAGFEDALSFGFKASGLEGRSGTGCLSDE